MYIICLKKNKIVDTYNLKNENRWSTYSFWTFSFQLQVAKKEFTTLNPELVVQLLESSLLRPLLFLTKSEHQQLINLCLINILKAVDIIFNYPSVSQKQLAIGEVDINTCFNSFTQEEILDGEEKPVCFLFIINKEQIFWREFYLVGDFSRSFLKW